MRCCRGLSLTIVLVLLGNAAAQSGHYKFSTLHWEKQVGTVNTVIFTLRSAWSTEFQPYKDQVASEGGVIKVGHVIRIQGLGDPVLQFGDGAESFAIVKATVISVDDTLKTWVGVAKVSYTYKTSSNGGAAWVASFRGCCRDADVQNRGTGFFQVSTSVHLARASFSPIIALLPRQVMTGSLSSPANSIWVPAYNTGERATRKQPVLYSWLIEDRAGGLRLTASNASVQVLGASNGSQIWGHVDNCNTSKPENRNRACLYFMRVSVTDVSTSAMSQVDFELEVLPANLSPFLPRYLETLEYTDAASSAAAQALPRVNLVYNLYSYAWRVQFAGGIAGGVPGGRLNTTGLLVSELPSGANLLAPRAAGPGPVYDSLLSWKVPADIEGSVVCVQAYNRGNNTYGGNSTYRDMQGRNLPLRSRQVCMQWSVSVDPAPRWLNMNVSAIAGVRTVYIGDKFTLSLAAHDENGQDNVTITSLNLPTAGSFAEQQLVGNSARNVTRIFSLTPTEKLGGLEGGVCFEAADRLRGEGGGGKAELCFKYRVPKCLYRVKMGQTLIDIASVYGVNWLQLWALNKNISRPEGHGLPGGIKAGDVLHIGQLVLVREGDSLERLAARFGTTLRQIIGLNRDITPTRPLTAGQLVCLVPSTCQEQGKVM